MRWSMVLESSSTGFFPAEDKSGRSSEVNQIFSSILILKDDSRLYCACSDFYYRVLSSKISECYHLLACKIALQEEMYVVVNFSDDEFPQFLRAIVSDNLKVDQRSDSRERRTAVMITTPTEKTIERPPAAPYLEMK